MNGSREHRKIKKITGEICKTARNLWEEVFEEDSKQFTDYYFANKAEKNIGYVIGKIPYDAMMFRTLYSLKIGERQRVISYIVGVATRKECRHRGYMRQLLLHSFREMYEEKEPFAFLMPANPAIYEPFDFRYIYERDVWELKEPEHVIEMLKALTFQEREEEDENNFLPKGLFRKEKLHGLYSVRNLRKHFSQLPILELLAEFANRNLEERYNIYVYRDVSYYEMQLKESEAQNGDIYVFFEQGVIKAFFLYAKEGEEIFIQEVMEEQAGVLDFLQKAEKKKPIIMARILHLEEMMKLVCSKENKTMIIEIKDELIPENAGVFRWELTPKGSFVTKIASKISDKDKKISCKTNEINDEVMKKETKICNEIMEDSEIVPEVSMHIRDFVAWVLTGVFLNEIV